MYNKIGENRENGEHQTLQKVEVFAIGERKVRSDFTQTSKTKKLGSSRTGYCYLKSVDFGWYYIGIHSVYLDL